MKSSSITWSIRLSLMGLAILGMGMVWTACHFKNMDGTSFNPLRNFVSELGSKKCSYTAEWFNRSLILSSPLLFSLVYCLGVRIKGSLGYAAIVVGFCALLGSLGVGLVPMEQLKPHLAAALLFFWGWLGTAFLFTVGFWRKFSFKAGPAFIVSGIVAMLCAASFLTALTRTMLGPMGEAFQKPNTFRRPLVWDIAVLEWCVVASFVAWVLTALFYLRRMDEKGTLSQRDTP